MAGVWKSEDVLTAIIRISNWWKRVIIGIVWGVWLARSRPENICQRKRQNPGKKVFWKSRTSHPGLILVQRRHRFDEFTRFRRVYVIWMHVALRSRHRALVCQLNLFGRGGYEVTSWNFRHSSSPWWAKSTISCVINCNWFFNLRSGCGRANRVCW
jgi:hypothetical protein